MRAEGPVERRGDAPLTGDRRNMLRMATRQISTGKVFPRQAWVVGPGPGLRDKPTGFCVAPFDNTTPGVNG
jgi:hypothetical protein